MLAVTKSTLWFITNSCTRTLQPCTRPIEQRYSHESICISSDQDAANYCKPFHVVDFQLQTLQIEFFSKNSAWFL